jgi:ketosteroid isomerase-like protein
MSAPDGATERTREIVASWLHGIEAGMTGAELGAHLADDVRWTLMGTLARSGTYTGKDAVFAFFAEVAGRFRPGSIGRKVRNVMVDGEYAAVELERSGVTAAGTQYRNNHVLVIRCANGKLADVREYVDTLAASAVGG